MAVQCPTATRSRCADKNGAMTPPVRATKLLEDAHVRVTRFDFDSGASTGQHVHEHDYMIVTVTGGDFVITHPDGSTTDMQQTVGAAYTRTKGTEHDVRFVGPGAAAFIEIELLDA